MSKIIKNTKSSVSFLSSVGNKILAVFTLLILLVTLFLSTFSFFKSRSGYLDLSKENLSARITESSKLLSEDLNNKIHQLDYIATLDPIRSMNWDIQYPELLKQAEYWGFLHIFIMDTNGISYYAEDHTIRDQSKEPFFDMVSGDKRVLTEPYVDGSRKLSITTITAPMKDENGKVFANICGVIDLNKINSTIQNIHVGKNGYAFIANKNGNFVAHKDMNIVYNNVCLADLKAEYSGLSNLQPIMKKVESKESGIDTFTVNNEKMIINYMPIESTPWSLFLAIPESELLARSRGMLVFQIIVSICAVIAGIMCSLYIRQWISNKINEIAKMSSELSDCNLSYTSESTGNDEFAQVIDSLNNSVFTLKSTVEEVSNNSTTLVESNAHIDEMIQDIFLQINESTNSIESISASMEESSAALLELNAASEEVIGNTTHSVNAASEGLNLAQNIESHSSEIYKNAISSKNNVLSLYNSCSKNLKDSIEKVKTI
ncbi:MAG TPA: hypothetical protein DG753_06510, partial [Clostridium sp.]|nr:hypothetical protein [Clostridium sp.]